MKKKLLKIAAIAGMCIMFITTTANAFTAVTSGNWSSAATWGGTAPGATVSSQDITIPSGLTVNLDMSVTFSGVLNSFTVDGTLNNSTANSVTMSQGAFAGSGSVTINKLVFTGALATMSYTGTLVINHFENSGGALTLAAVISVIDTLNLDAGSIVLNAGSNLQMMTSSTVKVNGGSMTIGGGIFNSSSSYNVLYVGASKTSGIELNTTALNNLYVSLSDNTQTLTLGGNLTVNGNIHMTSGKLDFSGKQLTFNGDLMIAAGSMFTSSTSSNLIVGGSTALTNGLTFTSGSSVDNFTINHTGSANVKLMSALNVSGNLMLMNGALSLESGSTMVMSSGSMIQITGGAIVMNSGTFNGTASYDVEYMGGTINSGIELSGAGLNNLTVNLTAMTDSVRVNNNTTVSGTLSMQNGQLRLNGKKLIVNGSMNQNSTSVFSGNSASELDLNLTSSLNDTLYFNPVAGYNVLANLIVNAGSSATVYLGSDLNIATQLSLTSGKLDIGNHNLVIQSAGTISSYDNTKYIVTSGTGVLQMRVNSASSFVTFPVGTASGYSPASVQQTATGTSGDFMVSTMAGIYSNGTSGWNSADHASVVNRTWLVSAAGGVTVNTNLKLGWLAADEVNGFDRTSAYIAHYHSSAWDTYTFGAATTGPSSTYEIERMGLTSLSPFAVVDSAASLTLGIDENSKPVSINIYPNPSFDVINIENPNVDDMYLYELVDITGKTILAASNKNTLNTFGLSDLSNGFYFIKATDLTTKKVITKRFVKS